MATKQDRRIAREHAADAAFAAIVEKALAVTKDRAAQRESWARPEGTTDGGWEVACAVRVLREQGIAWWQLAHALALPGSGDSVATGKSGASYARRLYRKVFGDYEPGQRASSAGSAERRAEAVGPWFTGRTVEEVLSAVAGKELTWRIRVSEGVETTDSAVVSPRGARQYGDDAISFHAVVYGVPEKGKGAIWMKGPERTVRVEAIIQVGPGIPAGERVY